MKRAMEFWWSCETLVLTHLLTHTQHLPRHAAECRAVWAQRKICPPKPYESPTQHQASRWFVFNLVYSGSFLQQYHKTEVSKSIRLMFMFSAYSKWQKSQMVHSLSSLYHMRISTGHPTEKYPDPTGNIAS